MDFIATDLPPAFWPGKDQNVIFGIKPNFKWNGFSPRLFVLQIQQWMVAFSNGNDEFFF